MAKDTYWFPHDYEPTSDPKMQAMLGDYGAVGYGIYWRIVEMLHSDQMHKLPFKGYIYSAIVKQMQTSVQQNKILSNSVELSVDMVDNFIKDCVSNYELFTSDDSFFWSERAVRNIEKKASISAERSKAGKNSAESKKKVDKEVSKSTNVKQVVNKSQQTSTITPQHITLQDTKRDYIIYNTHHRYSTKNEMQKVVVGELNNICLVFSEYMYMSEKHRNHLSEKISEKYFGAEKSIKNMRSLLLEWLERDKKANYSQYVNVTGDTPF